MGIQGNTEENKGIKENVGEYRIITMEMCK
jgi:hypothetical protein